jgi:hypothetical protein
MFLQHEVSRTTLPDDAQRILPLLGNDELKLCVDARGVMHDFEALPSFPPPRITWSGRRHNLRQDRYSSNLFEWGFLDLKLVEEASLPPVTGWRQRLHPREGYVETVITRGAVEERTLSFVHLEHNLLVFHREYRHLPADHPREVQAIYTCCHVGTETLPFRTTWQPHALEADGIAADTTADGLQLYRGCIALYADTTAQAQAVDNRLELSAPLRADGSVTIYLSLHDDLGDDPQLLPIPDGGWMSSLVREVNRENLERQAARVRPDPVALSAELRQWVRAAGFAGVFATQRAAWARFWAPVRVSLPPDEEKLTAVLETQLYTIRCSFTHYSLPANPFNTSWGAPYFWDERFPVEGLMGLGLLEMPVRTLEWRRRILPFSTMMTAGRGARYVASAVEPGSQVADRNGTQYYEFFQIGVLVNYLWQYCRYVDDPAILRRYYPIVRECAEFFRQWLLVELPGNTLMIVPLIDVDESHYPVQDGPFTLCGAARILSLAQTLAERLGLQEPEAPAWQRFGDMALFLARHLYRDTTAYVDYELFDLPAPQLEPDPAMLAWRDAQRQKLAPVHQFEQAQENVAGDKDKPPFWSWGPLQAAHSAATLGRPEEALERLQISLTTLMDFGALNESAKPDLSLVHHPWFTTAAGAFVRALTRMLLYPQEGELFLLPGIPAAWRQLDVTLPAYGGVTVRMALHEGRFSTLRLTGPAKSLPLTLHLPKRFLAEVPAGVGELVAETDEEYAIAVRIEGELVVLGGASAVGAASPCRPW